MQNTLYNLNSLVTKRNNQLTLKITSVALCLSIKGSYPTLSVLKGKIGPAAMYFSHSDMHV